MSIITRSLTSYLYCTVFASNTYLSLVVIEIKILVLLKNFIAKISNKEKTFLLKTFFFILHKRNFLFVYPKQIFIKIRQFSETLHPHSLQVFEYNASNGLPSFGASIALSQLPREVRRYKF